MNLCLFGVVHASPICRDRYLSRIVDMFRCNGSPSFIAVEWAPRLFHDVVLPQRDKFHELAMADTKFARYGAPFVDALAECIGFEADAHKHVYGPEGPPVLWLDEHRDCNVDDQKSAMSLRRKHYQWFKNYLKQQPCATVGKAFQCIHSGLVAHTSKDPKPAKCIYKRDSIWSEMICTNLRECSVCTYAIVIVGLYHIKSNPLSILSRLAGTVICEAIDITEV